jgi:hypothetical protein
MLVLTENTLQAASFVEAETGFAGTSAQVVSGYDTSGSGLASTAAEEVISARKLLARKRRQRKARPARVGKPVMEEDVAVEEEPDVVEDPVEEEPVVEETGAVAGASSDGTQLDEAPGHVCRHALVVHVNRIDVSHATGGWEYGGDLTHYGGAGKWGACTSTWVPPGYTTVAVNSQQWDEGMMCGTCVHACYTDNDGKRCFNAIIDNLCPECVMGDLDLGENGGGRWPLDWKIQPCPKAGSVQFTTQVRPPCLRACRHACTHTLTLACQPSYRRVTCLGA